MRNTQHRGIVRVGNDTDQRTFGTPTDRQFFSSIVRVSHFQRHVAWLFPDIQVPALRPTHHLTPWHKTKTFNVLQFTGTSKTARVAFQFPFFLIGPRQCPLFTQHDAFVACRHVFAVLFTLGLCSCIGFFAVQTPKFNVTTPGRDQRVRDVVQIIDTTNALVIHGTKGHLKDVRVVASCLR